MENSARLSIKNLVHRLQNELVGKTIGRAFIIKINSEKLSTMGEIYFPANLLAWREFVSRDHLLANLSSIFEYYLLRKQCDIAGLSTQDIFKKVSIVPKSLIAASKSWPVTIEKCSQLKGTICVFLSRDNIIKTAIKNALRDGKNYGRGKSAGKSICLSHDQDKDSDLTTVRLRLIKEVCEKVLEHQGYRVKDQEADYNFFLSAKSQGLRKENFHRCICGVVKNPCTNTKETSLTLPMYVEEKVKELEQLAEAKLTSEKNNLKTIANAVVTFELLSKKPSRPILIGSNEDSDRGVTNSKGGTFVLYNASRINAILEKYKKEEILGHYPSMPDINSVDFSLINQEEEWDLIYNFVNEYPDMIDDCARIEDNLETNPHVICHFLSRLSQKFSIYYRRTRILTEGRDHLVPTMMARLYLLRALQIVMNNSLEKLNIVPVSYM